MLSRLVSSVAVTLALLVSISNVPAQHADHDHAGHGHDAHDRSADHDDHDATARHRFEDVERWTRVFDDPERDEWQKPDDILAYLEFYADEEMRRVWAEDWPDLEIPAHADPPYGRDRHLPQPCWNASDPAVKSSKTRGHNL